MKHFTGSFSNKVNWTRIYMSWLVKYGTLIADLPYQTASPKQPTLYLQDVSYKQPISHQHPTMVIGVTLAVCCWCDIDCWGDTIFRVKHSQLNLVKFIKVQIRQCFLCCYLVQLWLRFTDYLSRSNLGDLGFVYLLVLLLCSIIVRKSVHSMLKYISVNN